MSDYPNSDPVAVGAPNSAIRREWEAWQELCHMLRVVSVAGNVDAMDACLKHPANGDCFQVGCRSIRAVKDWGKRAAEVALLRAGVEPARAKKLAEEAV